MAKEKHLKWSSRLRRSAQLSPWAKTMHMAFCIAEESRIAATTENIFNSQLDREMRDIQLPTASTMDPTTKLLDDLEFP